MTYKFSPSSLSLLKECPKCFWLHFNKGIKRPDTIFPSLPSGMDGILKKHFDFFMEKGELPPELQQLNGDVLFHTDLVKIKIDVHNAEKIFKDALDVLENDINDDDNDD